VYSKHKLTQKKKEEKGGERWEGKRERVSLPKLKFSAAPSLWSWLQGVGGGEGGVEGAGKGGKRWEGKRDCQNSNFQQHLPSGRWRREERRGEERRGEERRGEERRGEERRWGEEGNQWNKVLLKVSILHIIDCYILILHIIDCYRAPRNQWNKVLLKVSILHIIDCYRAPTSKILKEVFHNQRGS
jgi:hypothetical protein